MGIVRQKGLELLAPPTYPPESGHITLVLHYGGEFISKPTADYVGGDKVVYDYLNILDLRLANLSIWCEGLGVIGEMKFYGVLKNCFKWLWNDYELIEWTRSSESTGLVHVWVDGDVQKGSDQPHVHNSSETFEVPKGNDEDLQSKGMDKGETHGGNGEGEMAKCSEHDEVSEDNGYEESPLSSFSDSDYEFEHESTDDDDIVEGCNGNVEDVGVDVVCNGDGSDDDGVHEGRYPFLNNEIIFNPTFEVGMVFETKDVFREAVKSHAILTRKSLRFVRSDKRRVKARCCGEGCDWGINLVKRVNESTFRIKSYESAHKCDEDASDDEVHEGGYRLLNNNVNFNPSFEIDMVFETKDEFKKAVQSHAIQTRRSLRIVKNDKSRVYARCSGHNCEWGINLVKRVNGSTFKIKSYESAHKCAPTSSVSILNSRWLSERYASAFQKDPNINLERWRKNIMRELNVNVSRQQAIRARRKALRKGTHQCSSFKKISSSCTQAAGGEEEVPVEEGPEEPGHVTTKRQKLKVCGNKSASSSGVTHANETNLEEDFIVSGPSTRRKTRGRPRKSNVDNNSTQPPKSTWVLVDEDEHEKLDAEEGFIGNGTPITPGRKRGRPRKSDIDNNSTDPRKSTLGLVEEDENDKFEALHALGAKTNPEEDFIENGPLTTTRKKRGRPRKSNINNNSSELPKSTPTLVDENMNDKFEALHTLGATIYPEEDFIENGPPTTTGKKRGRPCKLNIDNNSSELPKSTLALVDEDMNDKFEALHTLPDATNPEEGFSANGPPTTSAKKRGRPRKLNINNNFTEPPKLTLGLVDEDEDGKFEALNTLGDATNPVEGFIANGPPTTSGKKRGRPCKSNIDNNSTEPPKSTLGLMVEDEDDKFAALHTLASSATEVSGLGMSTSSCTRSHTQYQPLQLSLTRPSKPHMLSGSLARGRPRKSEPSKSTMRLVDEDDKFEALLNLATAATNEAELGMSTVSCTRSHAHTLLQHKPERKAH